MKTTLVIPTVILLTALTSISVYAENECEKLNDKLQSEEKKTCDQLKQEAEERIKKDVPRKLSESDKGKATVKDMAEERTRLYEEWEKNNQLPNAQID